MCMMVTSCIHLHYSHVRYVFYVPHGNLLLPLHQHAVLKLWNGRNKCGSEMSVQYFVAFSNAVPVANHMH